MKNNVKFITIALCVLMIATVLVGCGKTYVVSYYENDKVISTAKVNENTVITRPKDPTKEGYTFQGWYTNKELTEEYKWDSKVTSDLKLYAKFTETKPATR